MIKIIILFCLFSLNLGVFARDLKDFDKFIKILGKLESNNNDFAVGDNGKSISRYQIQLKCYQDATNYNKTITFSYKSLTNEVNAARIVKAYCMRYEKQACLNSDYEKLARLWNSGPGWRKKKHLTDEYVIKFNNLARQNK